MRVPRNRPSAKRSGYRKWQRLKDSGETNLSWHDWRNGKPENFHSEVDRVVDEHCKGSGRERIPIGWVTASFDPILDPDVRAYLEDRYTLDRGDIVLEVR